MLQLIHQGKRILLVERIEGRRKFKTAIWLPKDLKTLTGRQTVSVVNYLRKKPLDELRWMQVIVYRQLELIRVHYASKRRVGFYDGAITNLQEMDRHLAAAIDFKEFGKGNQSCE